MTRSTTPPKTGPDEAFLEVHEPSLLDIAMLKPSILFNTELSFTTRLVYAALASGMRSYEEVTMAVPCSPDDIDFALDELRALGKKS